MKNYLIFSALFGGAYFLGSSNIKAQTFGMEYTTEWQTDFKGHYDWLNLLKISAEVPICESLTFEAVTISTAKTHESTLIDDLLTYSNIEAGNIPLTFGRLGFVLASKDASLFMGISNVNEDYFTSDLTSFFTNSSCGISPTLSCNYDIANYPLAAWCIHGTKQLGAVSVQTSLYPGQGYSRILGHDNLMSLKLKRDGFFSISSIDYKRDGFYCVLGTAVHYGVCIADGEGESEATPAPASPKKTLSAAPWLLSELTLANNLGMHAHASFSTVDRGCKAYAGAGVIYSGKTVKPGAALNYASFTSMSEYTAELTCRIPLATESTYIQPVIHLVKTSHSSLVCIGMLRLNICI